MTTLPDWIIYASALFGLAGMILGLWTAITNKAAENAKVLTTLGTTKLDIGACDTRHQTVLDRLEEIIGRLIRLEERLTPLWDMIIKELPKILISPHTQELDEFIRMYMNGFEHMTKDELLKMKELLEAEFNKGQGAKDSLKVTVATITLSTIKAKLGYLGEKINDRKNRN